MRTLITLLITLLVSVSIKADEIAYNFDYSLENVDTECNDLDDPLEPVNRKIFYFNSFMDYIILKPVAKAYGKIFNDYTRNRVGDFVDNIYEPLTTVNYGLQGNIDKFLSSFWKFATNTTFGIAGTYDLASELGLNHKPQTFGSTLAHYGASSGPYIVLPLLGGTNMRDMLDVVGADDKLNPLRYSMSKGRNNTYSVIRLVHKRNEIMPFTDYISKNSTDPYAALRSAMHQRRESLLDYPKGYKCGVRPSRLKNSY